MKRLLIIPALCLLFASVAQAERVKVKLRLQSKRSYTGTLIEPTSKGVSFLPVGAAAAVVVPSSSIAYMEFRLDDEQEASLVDLFEGGDYVKLAPRLNELLPNYLPYIKFASNHSDKMTQWLTASYWTGDYDRVLQLADAMKKSGNAAFIDKPLFYSTLVRLEKGEKEAVESFLKSPKGSEIFPEKTAARSYVDARLLQMNKQYVRAIRTACELIALHGRDADWMPQAELLCAELYFKIGRPESAQAVLDSVEECYTNPLIIKKAAAIAAQN